MRVTGAAHLREQVFRLAVPPDVLATNQATAQVPVLLAEIQESQDTPRVGRLAVVPLPRAVVAIGEVMEAVHQVHPMVNKAATAMVHPLHGGAVVGEVLRSRRHQERKSRKQM